MHNIMLRKFICNFYLFIFVEDKFVKRHCIDLEFGEYLEKRNGLDLMLQSLKKN